MACKSVFGSLHSPTETMWSAHSRWVLQKLGNGAAPLLAPLAPAEAKLVAIYVQRAIDAQRAGTTAV